LKEIDGNAISIENANKNYMVYILGKKPEGVEIKDLVLKNFKNYGDVTIGDV